jgi:hypothetical protein
MLNYKLAVTTLMLVLLAGCASNTVPDPEPGDSTYDAAGSGADTDIYGDDPMGDGQAIDDDSTSFTSISIRRRYGRISPISLRVMR